MIFPGDLAVVEGNFTLYERIVLKKGDDWEPLTAWIGPCLPPFFIISVRPTQYWDGRATMQRCYVITADAMGWVTNHLNTMSTLQLQTIERP